MILTFVKPTSLAAKYVPTWIAKLRNYVPLSSRPRSSFDCFQVVNFLGWDNLFVKNEYKINIIKFCIKLFFSFLTSLLHFKNICRYIFHLPTQLKTIPRI